MTSDTKTDTALKEAPDAGRLYFEMFNEIGIIAQLSRAAFEARLPDGLTVPHFSVLNHLVRLGDGRTPLSIAKAFQVPKTSMTHTLAGLADRGLVSLDPNPEDGRSKLVHLTPAGRQMRSNGIDLLTDDIATLVPQFSPEQVSEVLPHLIALRQIMDAARD